MKKELIAYREPKNPISEVFRTLRTNIQFMNTDKKLKSLLVTSTSPGEGKSWIASNLAVTFAQAGKRVILVDADMRKGRQYTIFGVLPKPGLSNYLSGVNEYEENSDIEDVARYIQKTKVNNLCLMVAGNVPPNPSELLISSRMIRLIDQLNQLADIVIIDGTPCDLVTDSVILSRIVDSTVVVTSHSTTKKDGLKRTINSIKNVGGKVVGVVLNKIPISEKRYKKAYYYNANNTNDSKQKNRRKSARKEKNKRKTSIENKAKELYDERLKREAEEEKFQEKMEIEVEMEKEAKKKNKNVKNVNVEKQRKQDNSSTEEEEISRENDILRQINEYLAKEKKEL